MLGMSLLSFLVLALIGEIVSVAYHDIVRYRFLKGRDALFGKLIVGWIGAWLGSPVLGHWLLEDRERIYRAGPVGRDRRSPLDRADGEGACRTHKHPAR